MSGCCKNLLKNGAYNIELTIDRTVKKTAVCAGGDHYKLTGRVRGGQSPQSKIKTAEIG